MPEGDVVVDERTNEEKIRSTLRKQTNEYDRLWFWLLNKSLGGMMEDAKNLLPEDKQQLREDPNTILQNAPDPGYEPNTKLYEEDDNPIKRCKHLMYLMGVFEMRLALETGLDQMKEEEKLSESEVDPAKRKEMAAYLVKNGSPKSMRMYNEFKMLQTALEMQFKGMATSSLVVGNNPIDKNTTMEQLADRLDFTTAQADAFYKKYGAKKSNKAFDVFQKSLKDKLDAEKKNKRRPSLALRQYDAKKEIDVMSYLTKECNEYLIATWKEKGKKDVLDTLTDVEKEMVERGRNLVRARADKGADITVWIRDKGQKEAAKKKVQNINQEAKPLIHTVTSDKSMKMRSGRGMDRVFMEELYQIDADFINDMIAKLESTKTGDSIDSFLWHRQNSDKYERMLKSVKAYEKAIIERKSGEAADRKEEMLKRVYEYLDGKEKVRKHDFGEIRFNIGMMLIRKFDTDANFDAMCNHINRIRKEKPGSSDYMDAAALHNFANRYDLEALGKERYYNQSRRFATAMTDEQKERFVILESVYSQKPNRTGVLEGAFKKSEFDKLKVYDRKHCQITTVQRKEDDKALAGREFTAIAYAASLSEKACDKAAKYFPANSDKNSRAFLYSSRYTSVFMSGMIPSSVGKLAPVIQYGREKAHEALKEYKEGKKEKLAGILANAIQKITEKAKIKTDVDDEYLADSEMAGRMYRILRRDGQLFDLAIQKGLKPEMLKKVECMNVVSGIYGKYVIAKNELEKAENLKEDPLTAEDKKRLMTDVVSYYHVKKWMTGKSKNLDLNQAYNADKEALSRQEATAKREVENKIETLRNKYPNGVLVHLSEADDKKYQEYREKERELNALYRGKENLLKLKYMKESVMIDQLKEPGAADKLRRDVDKLVQEKIDQAIREGKQFTSKEARNILSGIDSRMRFGNALDVPGAQQRGPQLRAGH